MAAETESEYPSDWFRIASEDFARVAKRIAEGDVDDAAFRLQQALEKYLKGYLLAHGWRLRRTHDIEALFDDALHYQPRLEQYRALCQSVTGYYLLERYPTFETGPSLVEVQEAYGHAKAFIHELQVGSRRGHRS